jgi:4-carboxymuconolactone decarboxylase
VPRRRSADELPARYLPAFERAFPNVHVAHQELAKTCYEGGPLDARSARLVKLGVAIGAGRGCRAFARSPGAGREHNPEEVHHVGLLALTTLAFPHTVAGLGWIDELIASKD